MGGRHGGSRRRLRSEQGAAETRAAPITNAEVADALTEIGLYLEMEEVPFKPRAYEKAAYAVRSLAEPIGDILAAGGVKALTALPGIGAHTANRIEELVTTGAIADLEALRNKRPIDLLGLTAVEGLGPKKAKILYDKLGIRTLDELAAAARDGKIRGLAQFGQRSEEKILSGLDLAFAAAARAPFPRVLGAALAVEARLRACRGVSSASMAGSLRRRKETIGDLDFIVASTEPDAVIDTFVALPDVVAVHARGHTKALVRLRSGIDADLRVVPADSYGSALAYFTGSKAHNVALRTRAMKRKLKLNEYGLFDERGRRLAGRTEEEVYAALGLDFVPPELREDSGEIEAAEAGRLPRLLTADDLRGDLQMHTDWTDGSNSLEEMVAAAAARGLEYVAVTDHTRDLAMTGMSEERLLEQARAIRRLAAARSGRPAVLAGAEVNIRRDGSLDVSDAALAELDVVGAAVHSLFKLPRAEMTARMIRAIENPHVDILFHPTGRSFGHRPPQDFDVDAVIAAAARTGTALEIDAQPERLDLGEELARNAARAGVAIALDSDAHSRRELRFCADYGVCVARRAWLTPEQVLNALPLSQLRRRLHRPAC